jgi:hypothetical protein
MSFDYVAMQAVSTTLLAQFGSDYSFTRSVYAYNPATGETTSTSQNWVTKAVILAASKGTVEAFDDRFMSGTLIETNLRAMIIAYNSSFNPLPGDTVIAEGAQWNIVGVTPLSPAGTEILFKASIRKP